MTLWTTSKDRATDFVEALTMKVSVVIQQIKIKMMFPISCTELWVDVATKDTHAARVAGGSAGEPVGVIKVLCNYKFES